MELVTSVKIIKNEVKKEILEEKHNNFKVFPFEEKEIKDILKKFSNYELDPNYIISYYHDKKKSVFILLSGEEVIIKTKEDEYLLRYENIEDFEYSIIDRKIKITTIETDVELSDEILGEKFPFNLISEIFEKVISSDVIKISLNQNSSVAKLSKESKLIYLKILTSFLKADDGIIDDKEYQELCSIMANIKTDRITTDELREYRYQGEYNIFDEYTNLVKQLKETLIYVDKVEPERILQSLASDIVNIHKNEVLNKWRELPQLVEVLGVLNISNKQVETLILVREKEKRALTEKLDNKSFSSLQKEIATILGASGLTYAGVGVLALFIGTGVGAILGLGYASYKVTQKVLNLGSAEKYSMQNEVLRRKWEQLSKTNAYIIEDINYLNAKNRELVLKLEQNREYNFELIQEFKNLMYANDSISKASMNVVKDQENLNIEILLRKLPETLDVNLFDKLALSSINYNDYNDVIYSVYGIDLESESAEYVVIEKENNDLLEEAYSILEKIGYFDSMSATLSATTKKTKEVVEEITSGENIKKGLGSFKSFLKK